MRCHCNEIETLRVENDLLRQENDLLDGLLKGALSDRHAAWAKLARIEELVQREEERMAAGPVLFDGSHFPAAVTAGELREVLDA